MWLDKSLVTPEEIWNYNFWRKYVRSRWLEWKHFFNDNIALWWFVEKSHHAHAQLDISKTQANIECLLGVNKKCLNMQFRVNICTVHKKNFIRNCHPFSKTISLQYTSWNPNVVLRDKQFETTGISVNSLFQSSEQLHVKLSIRAQQPELIIVAMNRLDCDLKCLFL